MAEGKIHLPPDTRQRWEQIVINALRAKRDIATLVQQYAEQSFNARLTSLDKMGARRRMLARARPVVVRELELAQAHLRAEPPTQPPTLSRFYAAHRITLAEEGEAAPPAASSGRRGAERATHAVVAVAERFTKRTQLERHVAQLAAQLNQVDGDMPRIDALLNRGLQDKDTVVAELAAVSRELYRIAQEVAAKLPPEAARTPGAGAVASTPMSRTTDADPAPSTNAGAAGAATPDTTTEAAESLSSAKEADAGATASASRTVPINPLPLFSDALSALVFGFASAIGAVIAPAAGAAATAAGALWRPVASGVTAASMACARAWAGIRRVIADAWPWRGPPT